MKPSKIHPQQRYGNLVVLSRDSSKNNKKPFWVCKCDCGNETIVRADNLTSGRTESCGCFRASKFLSSVENIQTCKQLFEEGNSIDRIAQIMRISPSNVQKFLSNSGIDSFISREDLSNYRNTDKLRWTKKYVGFGMSLIAIAKAENTTPATVLSALTKLGIPTREPGSQTEEQKSRFRAIAQEYWQFYESGLSCEQIGETFGVAGANVSYILRAHGYKLRTTGEANKNFHKCRRIGLRKEIRQLILARGVKLSESRKASKLKQAEGGVNQKHENHSN